MTSSSSSSVQSKSASTPVTLDGSSPSAVASSASSFEKPKPPSPAIARPTPIRLPAAISNSLNYARRPLLPWEQKGIDAGIGQKEYLIEEEEEELEVKIGGLTIEQLEDEKVSLRDR